MAGFHLNGKGEPGRCSAQPGNCPFGGEENHYSTPEKARQAYELSMAAEVFSRPGPGQPPIPGLEVAEPARPAAVIEAPLTPEEEEALGGLDEDVRAPEAYRDLGYLELHEVLDEEESEARAHAEQMEYERRNKWTGL